MSEYYAIIKDSNLKKEGIVDANIKFFIHDRLKAIECYKYFFEHNQRVKFNIESLLP